MTKCSKCRMDLANCECKFRIDVEKKAKRTREYNAKNENKGDK